MADGGIAIPDSEAPVAAPKKSKASIWAKLFAVIVIIFMASWAVALYYQGQDSDTSDGTNKGPPDFQVNGYDFYNMQAGTFATYIDVGGKETPIAFRLDPRNASNISLDETAVTEILNATKIYIATNPNNQTDYGRLAVAAAEIARIPPLYNIDVVAAFTEDANPPNPNVPIRTCNDTTATIKVIYVHIGNTTEIKNVGGCIHVTGETPEELISAADKLGYNLVGIKI